MQIRSGDTVQVITGSDRGQRAKVLTVLRAENKLVVEGVNQVYKHVKRSQKNPQGGRLSKEMPIPASNVMLVCASCGQATRVGTRYESDGSKVRFCKKCSATISQIAPARASYAKKA